MYQGTRQSEACYAASAGASLVSALPMEMPDRVCSLQIWTRRAQALQERDELLHPLESQLKTGVLQLLWFYTSLIEAKLRLAPSAMMTYCDSPQSELDLKIHETCRCLIAGILSNSCGHMMLFSPLQRRLLGCNISPSARCAVPSFCYRFGMTIH